MEFIYYHPTSKASFFINEGVAIRSLLVTGIKTTTYCELGIYIDDYLHPELMNEGYKIGLIKRFFAHNEGPEFHENWDTFIKIIKEMRAHKHPPRKALVIREKNEQHLREKLKSVNELNLKAIETFEAVEVINFFRDNVISNLCPPRHFNKFQAEDMFIKHLTQSLIDYDKMIVMPSELHQPKEEKPEGIDKENFNKGKSEMQQSIDTSWRELYTIPNIKSLNYNQLKAAINEFSYCLKPVLDAIEQFKQIAIEKKFTMKNEADYDAVVNELFEHLLPPIKEQINNSIYFQHIVNKKETYPETTVCVGCISFKGLVYMYYHMKFYSYNSALSIIHNLSKHRDVNEVCVFVFNKVVYENEEYLNPEARKGNKGDEPNNQDPE
jgi:hypothetical protein